MITRPLDLASKLRREPQSFDWLFFANGGLIALFFGLFGSPFVLAPSLGAGFRLPEMAGANGNAQPATHYASITDAGQIFVRDGVIPLEKFPDWLDRQIAEARTAKVKSPQEPTLLVQASAGVPSQLLTKIFGAASKAGFKVRFATEEPKESAGPAERGGR